MKKLLATLVLVLALPAFGQAVDSSQVKKGTNGGVVGDSANALWIAPYRGTSAPSSPVTGALYCDTNFTPCILKQYTGSTWTAPAQTPAVPTQSDASSFPGSPVDGQIFFSKSPYALYIYDSTAGAWLTTHAAFNVTAPTVRDVYASNTTITAPGAAPTAATDATAGSLGSGCYSYKVTFVSATGGETTASAASNSVTPGVNKSADLSSIPTGGTGTTSRRIYRSKSGSCAAGPWYYTTKINDNSTTTLTAEGLTDGSQKGLAPTLNFSGPPPGNWTFNAATNGQIGGLGMSSRSTMVCHGSARPQLSGNTSIVSDVDLGRCTLDISSYASGDYTITYRVTGYSIEGSTLSVVSPCPIGFRIGTADNAIRIGLCTGSGDNQSGTWTGPFSSSNHIIGFASIRSSVGGAASNFLIANTFPEVDALPFWVRMMKRGAYYNTYWSADGVNWNIHAQCTGTSNTTANCSWSAPTGNGVTLFEIPMGRGDSGTVSQGLIEIDSFTLTVN